MKFQHTFEEGSDSLTILSLPGAGGSEGGGESDWRDLEGLWPDANFLSVRGRVAQNGNARFFRCHSEGAFDVENLKSEANALADFTVWASGEYSFDAANVWALGYSDGASIAAGLFFLRPATLGGAVLLRAMTPLQQDLPDLSGKQILLLAGDTDDLVPTQEIQDLSHHFRAAGADVTLEWSDADHSLSAHDVEAARSWLVGRI